MRENLARLVSLSVVGLVVALSAVFAVRHNLRVAEESKPRNGEERSQPQTHSAPDLVRRGREVYAEHNCAACHAIAGSGNPRAPLDGVGGRRSSESLRAWITATGEADQKLPAGVARRKQRYREMPGADMEALIAYLGSLRLER